MRRLVPFTLAIVTTTPAGAQPRRAPTGLVPIVIETQLGSVEAMLDSAHAPVSVANFLRYVDANLYENAIFHRTVTPGNQSGSPVRIEVIQGSLGPAHSRQRLPPIPIERTTVTGLHHRDGTLSVARAGPESGADEFFICIGDQPDLDFGGKRNPDGQGFAAFGRVTKGMDVVRRIQRSHAHGQRLDPPVTITRITRKR
jgi:peptidyl-prolyl cis-trans isomerase A (cyclophilin A)